MHLAKEMHNVICQITEIWCPAQGWRQWDASWDASKVTCRDCLKAAIAHGDDARRRLDELDHDAMMEMQMTMHATRYPQGADDGEA